MGQTFHKTEKAITTRDIIFVTVAGVVDKMEHFSTQIVPPPLQHDFKLSKLGLVFK